MLLLHAGSVMAHGGTATQRETDEGVLSVTVDGRLVEGQAWLSSDLSELMVPLRSVAEQLGAEVKWDEEHMAVWVDSHSYPETGKERGTATSSSMSRPVSIVYHDRLVVPDLDPMIMNGSLMVSGGTVADLFHVSIKLNTMANRVQIVTPEALKQFDREESQVRDMLNGVGMTPHIAADGAKEFTLTAEIAPWSPCTSRTGWTAFPASPRMLWRPARRSPMISQPPIREPSCTIPTMTT